jgi:hypothetical protein
MSAFLCCQVDFHTCTNEYDALELDQEKVHSYVTERIIHWEDIVEISEGYSRNGAYIKFDIVDDSIQNIDTKWVTGMNKELAERA